MYNRYIDSSTIKYFIFCVLMLPMFHAKWWLYMVNTSPHKSEMWRDPSMHVIIVHCISSSCLCLHGLSIHVAGTIEIFQSIWSRTSILILLGVDHKLYIVHLQVIPTVHLYRLPTRPMIITYYTCTYICILSTMIIT